MSEQLPPRFDVLGSQISLTSYEQVFRSILEAHQRSSFSIAFCNVHTVMTARQSPALKQALEDFDVASPDGVPLVWALRALYGVKAERVHGPTFMRYAIDLGRKEGLRHFLLGSTRDTLESMQTEIDTLYPGALLVGAVSPPFRNLHDSDISKLVEEVKVSGAHIVWVGMGMPKQELLIHRIKDDLTDCTLLGVGAAFDLIARNLPEAPDWMKRSGMEWAYRLLHEPMRLWRRYAVNNPMFLVLLGREVLRTRGQ